MKKLMMMVAVVAAAGLLVSCGVESKAKRFGKKIAKLENKQDKIEKKYNDWRKGLSEADKEKADKAYDEAHKKYRKKTNNSEE